MTLTSLAQLNPMTPDPIQISGSCKASGGTGSVPSAAATERGPPKPHCPVDAFVSNASDKEGNPLFDAIETIASTGFAAASGMNLSRKTDAKSKTPVSPSVELVRAQAIWREVVAGVAKSPTALFARLDALLDPERVEDANMLAEWRRKYENEITMRTKDRWWRKWLSGGVGRRRGWRDR